MILHKLTQIQQKASLKFKSRGQKEGFVNWKYKSQTNKKRNISCKDILIKLLNHLTKNNSFSYLKLTSYNWMNEHKHFIIQRACEWSIKTTQINSTVSFNSNQFNLFKVWISETTSQSPPNSKRCSSLSFYKADVYFNCAKFQRKIQCRSSISCIFKKSVSRLFL